jgi:hypothetical protein
MTKEVKGFTTPGDSGPEVVKDVGEHQKPLSEITQKTSYKRKIGRKFHTFIANPFNAKKD